MGSLNKYNNNKYSANGEDGIIREILSRLKINVGIAVEFGAWDGLFDSNTYNLLAKKWKIVFIEGDKKRFKDLLVTRKKNKDQITPINKYVKVKGPNALDSLLSSTKIPIDFEILSIDIDSYDYWIWNSVKKFRPLIVIIEVNSSINPLNEYIHPPTNKPANYPFKGDGSSIRAMIKLGKSKGYSLACHTGNAIFVRNDMVHLLRLPWYEAAFPILLYKTDWLKYNIVYNYYLKAKQFLKR